jgi:hypothetical protein
MNSMMEIARDTFKAFKGHRTLFFPIPGCFEVFGLANWLSLSLFILVALTRISTCCRFDFMVDSNGNVFLLEINQGPGLMSHIYIYKYKYIYVIYIYNIYIYIYINLTNHLHIRSGGSLFSVCVPKDCR